MAVKGKTKDKTKPAKRGPAGRETITGTYKYDPVSGKVVKVSSRIPGVAAKSSGAGSDEDFGSDAGDSADAGPCGRTECGGGTCAGGASD